METVQWKCECCYFLSQFLDRAKSLNIQLVTFCLYTRWQVPKNTQRTQRGKIVPKQIKTITIKKTREILTVRVFQRFIFYLEPWHHLFFVPYCWTHW